MNIASTAEFEPSHDHQQETAQSDEGLRRCNRCCRMKPITEFRRIYASDERRQHTCRECRNRQRRAETQLKREQDTHRYAQHVNQLADEQQHARIMAVTNEMVDRFKGVDNFVATWKRALDRAGSKGRHATVCRGLLAVLNLVSTCSVLQEERNPATLLDDNDVQVELERAAMRVVAKNPVLALHAARQLGWTVKPPDE